MFKARSLHADVTSRLAPISDTPALDASVLIAHVLDKPRTWTLAHPEVGLSEEQQTRLDDSLARLENGEPLPYVLGLWEFFGLEFEITPNVLIPRPETELLVEKAIAWLQKNPQHVKVADIGTGSGVIAVSIAVNVPHVRILATDVSSKVLQVAKRNATRHRVEEKIEFIECDIFPKPTTADQVPDLQRATFDLLCANLPYIPTKTLSRLPIYGKEPTLALDGGADGLDTLRKLLKAIPGRLASNGLILLEIEATLGVQSLELARNTFNMANIKLHQDLTGRDRLIEIQT